ncbi:hypothetical protein PPYR_02129 [Photinus pyralis]|uniref:YqaJ viral recombinase domain-containing protein n=1 Tax=Photinus pyralis TaxID=7054 RepID=A0A5N4B6D6_PHOPY|nr:hypothetical protein PPYR_02129 [Photinus pyralis]
MVTDSSRDNCTILNLFAQSGIVLITELSTNLWLNYICGTAEQLGFKINECGFFIGSEELYFLGASPDGVIDSDTIIEIKCPYSARDSTIADAIKNKIITYATIEPGQLKLKGSHNYMYQIQGQLAITNRKCCYFIVWTKKDMMFEKIKKDELFWQDVNLNCTHFILIASCQKLWILAIHESLQTM